MPFYRYECDDCCRVVEKRRRISNRDDNPVCPDCGSEETKRMVSRFNTGASPSAGDG